MQISEEAVEAAWAAVWDIPHIPTSDITREEMKAALEAAAPHMLSHEREQTRLAHLDAMVNLETSRAQLAEAWDEGNIAGIFDLPSENHETPNPYRSNHGQ